jgi:hypothetical protein
MKALCVTLIVLVLVACNSHTDKRTLPNGYAVFAAGSTELYLANPQRELLLGPTLVSIGIVDPYVVVYCGWENSERNGFANTVGYNILNTKDGLIEKRLSEDAARAWLTLRGLQFPTMSSPSSAMAAAQK